MNTVKYAAAGDVCVLGYAVQVITGVCVRVPETTRPKYHHYHHHRHHQQQQQQQQQQQFAVLVYPQV